MLSVDEIGKRLDELNRILSGVLDGTIKPEKANEQIKSMNLKELGKETVRVLSEAEE